jgi:hypothetical protein
VHFDASLWYDHAMTKIEELSQYLHDLIATKGSPLPDDDYDTDSWNHIGALVDPKTGKTFDRYERHRDGVQGRMDIPRKAG